MSKVAIVTLVSKNYGNRLQNLALQETLVKLGHNVFTIPVYPYHLIRHNVKYLFKKCSNLLLKKYPDIVWDDFDKKVKWSSDITTDRNIAAKYDFFVAGSDQIWNPNFSITSDRELLTFAPPEKRIAYSASIGLSTFPEQFANHYAEEWKKFKNISVREYQASTIIYNLTQILPPVVLDPTLLLDKSDWFKFIKTRKIPTKYYIKYFLGKQNNHIDKCISKCVKNEHAQFINITNIDGSLKSGIGPSEFLNLLYYSEGVFTDSFHGTVFSIIFEKPFIVFRRPSEKGYGDMNSRIDSLISMLNLQSHFMEFEDNLDKIDFNFDYDTVKEIINKKRDESIFFLKNSLL